MRNVEFWQAENGTWSYKYDDGRSYDNMSYERMLAEIVIGNDDIIDLPDGYDLSESDDCWGVIWAHDDELEVVEREGDKND